MDTENVATKLCKDCDEPKELTEYHPSPHSSDGYQHMCKDCHKIRMNTSKTTKRITLPNKANMWTDYNLTIRQFVEMWTTQGGLCAICNNDLNDDVQIGHSHTSGNVRGLLCRNCNIMLGHAKDNPTTLENALKYVCGRP